MLCLFRIKSKVTHTQTHTLAHGHIWAKSYMATHLGIYTDLHLWPFDSYTCLCLCVSMPPFLCVSIQLYARVWIQHQTFVRLWANFILRLWDASSGQQFAPSRLTRGHVDRWKPPVSTVRVPLFYCLLSIFFGTTRAATNKARRPGLIVSTHGNTCRPNMGTIKGTSDF